MAEHKHGSMDITVQEKTFEGFINFTIRSVIVILCIVIFMAIFNS
ncbi:aa3-type cytochrome c oxidase subunit IV [Mameliella sediminis]|nr:aa3-type cytochrome c oxidase subunit IV [Mameliella sediminis]MBY6113420.1 aa3-type cytochrome c oxidase subunit IV [Antarctobacter heliothermus]MBY6143232.1 aa3-type cytochrome c oxidase subunit IV [Mameliella alba]MBV7394718.1 aa3-type cytochrome c oxidase subunit IV [Mameliella sediminis]MBY6163167.1 aa3-type cytochrome c oxidase subunit IV [Mameliella alba]MBY6171431.1 aa3-type cytochrome c oxidase subunit IV [Mameliella alba]